MSGPLSDRLPPQNLDAERSVLGSMLRLNRVIGDMVNLLTKDHFYADAHQKIYQTITEHWNKGGQPVDLLILADQLKLRAWLEDVGGPVYLAELWDAAPSAANAEHYARIVRDKALVRGLIEAGTEILAKAYNQASPAEQLIEEAAGTVFEMASKGLGGSLVTLEAAIRETYDRIDARSTQATMAHSGLNTGFTELNELTAGLQQGELIIIAARPSVGKCLASDSEIVLADGSITTIAEVYRRQQARLLTLGEDWRLGWAEPSAFVDDGKKPVYRVTLHSGRRIETTLSHPFRTVEGWRPLGELAVGEAVAVPRVLPVEGREMMRECEVKLLAYLIGDGTLKGTTARFTNGSERIREDFKGAVEGFGGLRATADDRPDRTFTYRIRTDEMARASRWQTAGRNLRVAMEAAGKTQREVADAVGVSVSLVGLWAAGKSAASGSLAEQVAVAVGVPIEDVAGPGPASPLRLWLEGHGLWGKRAAEKFVPSSVFRLPKAQLALFLNRLYATDGWASTGPVAGGTQIGYATTSERLGRQIQHLLLRFGILSRLHARQVLYKGGRRPCWQLLITNRGGLERFIADIGIYGKEEAVERVRAALAERGHKPFRDTVPADVWQVIDQARGMESWASLARRAGIEGHSNMHQGKRGLSRQRLRRLGVALGHEGLARLAESDVNWDRIASIEPLGEKQVYDLTIPGTHNFIANDICVHNTAFSLALTKNVLLMEKVPVFYVSLEQSRIELAERMLCAQARVDSHRLRKGTLTSDDMEKLIDAGSSLQKAHLFIDDSPQQGMLRIAANARRLKHQKDIRLIVIDYLQLIEPENRRDPRQEQVAQISRRLKFLAKELQVPVIALAQVNRAAEDRQDHRPRLSDLRESGSIEQDADTVFMLHRPDRYEPGQHEGILEIIVAKQRNGPTGEVTLAYIKQYLAYEDFKVGTPFDH